MVIDFADTTKTFSSQLFDFYQSLNSAEFILTSVMRHFVISAPLCNYFAPLWNFQAEALSNWILNHFVICDLDFSLNEGTGKKKLVSCKGYIHNWVVAILKSRSTMPRWVIIRVYTIYFLFTIFVINTSLKMVCFHSVFRFLL